jgi:hypothetical protein
VSNSVRGEMRSLFWRSGGEMLGSGCKSRESSSSDTGETSSEYSRTRVDIRVEGTSTVRPMRSVARVSSSRAESR